MNTCLFFFVSFGGAGRLNCLSGCLRQTLCWLCSPSGGSKRLPGRIVGGRVPQSACFTEGVVGQKLFGRCLNSWGDFYKGASLRRLDRGYYFLQNVPRLSYSSTPLSSSSSSPFLVCTRYPDLGDKIPWGGGAAISVQWSKMGPGHSEESLLSEIASPQK